MKLRKQFAVPAGMIVRVGTVWGWRGHMLRSRIRAKYDDLTKPSEFSSGTRNLMAWRYDPLDL
jgi:hypothetical protein